MSIRFLQLLVAGVLSASFAIAQSPLKSPNEFLPHELGEQFTPHHLLSDYYAYLAANAPQHVKIQHYGWTNEARPLQIVCISSAENIQRLDEIRENNLRLAGLSNDSRPGETNNMPAIVWLNMSVHGNEPSGSECGMLLAWQLAAQQTPEVREWLKNTVVIIDPSANPDGYDRYTSWYRAVSHREKNPSHATREHQEPWPGGRPNHYYFDLNRDWAWATQVETQQRLKVYQNWLPHILADVHEQGIDDPYYFAPAAEPMHAYLSPWQREFQTNIGSNHAQYFDKNGWLYFTNEVFDLFYPSYGDTYPMFNGAIGMTYEQAGNGRAGRAIKTANGDTLTLHDRIIHQLTTCRSTIEMAGKNREQLVRNFADYYAKAVNTPPGTYSAYILSHTNDPNKTAALCTLLDRHKIRYGRAGVHLSGVKGFDYKSNKETTSNISPDDVVISAYQPKAVLVQALFEPNPYLSDSLTYDITAWSLPFAHGLEAFAARQRIDPKKNYNPIKADAPQTTPPPYAWCAHRHSLADQAWAAFLLEKGVKIRYATEAFAFADQQFEPGAFVVNRADNRHLPEGVLEQLLRDATARSNAQTYPVYSGTLQKGLEIGSSKFKLVNTPSVGVLYQEDCDENALGHTWYFFEQELGYPLSLLRTDKLNSSALEGINTIIMPNGPGNIDEKTLSLLREWVSEGGRLIAFEDALKRLADKPGFDLASKPEKEGNINKENIPFLHTERHQISEQLPGAIIRAEADPTHPLAYGIGKVYYSLKTNPAAYQLNNKLSHAIWIGEQLESYGFIGHKVKSRQSDSPVASMQQMGNGTVIYLADSPVFRSFWQNGKMILANALFF